MPAWDGVNRFEAYIEVEPFLVRTIDKELCVVIGKESDKVGNKSYTLISTVDGRKFKMTPIWCEAVDVNSINDIFKKENLPKKDKFIIKYYNLFGRILKEEIKTGIHKDEYVTKRHFVSEYTPSTEKYYVKDWKTDIDSGVIIAECYTIETSGWA